MALCIAYLVNDKVRGVDISVYDTALMEQFDAFGSLPDEIKQYSGGDCIVA